MHTTGFLTVQLFEVVVRFVNINGIVDHLCLNFCLYEEFENTKGVNIIRKSRKDRQHNGQNRKGQTTIYKTLHNKLKIDIQEPNKKPGVNTGRVSSSCFTSGTCCTLVTNPVISHEWWKNQEVLTTGGTYPWSFVNKSINDERTRKCLRQVEHIHGHLWERSTVCTHMYDRHKSASELKSASTDNIISNHCLI